MKADLVLGVGGDHFLLWPFVVEVVCMNPSEDRWFFVTDAELYGSIVCPADAVDLDEARPEWAQPGRFLSEFGKG